MARLRQRSNVVESAQAPRAEPTRALRDRQTSPMRATRHRMREDASDDSDNLDDSDVTDDSSDALSADDLEDAGLQSSPPRARRRGRPHKANPTVPAVTRTKPSARKDDSTKRAKGRPSTASRQKRPVSRSQAGSRTPTKKAKVEVQLPVRQGRIPPWTDMRVPYAAWVAIFSYASMDCPNSWLVDCATVCKTFLEPALTSLYCNPFPSSTPRLRRLADLIARDPSETIMNYRMKVEYLTLDIKDTPASVYFPLIHPLPRLKHLFIVTSLDRPPYRDLDSKLRWNYPQGMFKALESGASIQTPETQDTAAPSTGASSTSESQPTDATSLRLFVKPEDKPFPTALRTWEWSGRMIGGTHGAVPTIQDLARIHREPYFQHLTTLSFTNFQTPSLLGLASNTTATSVPTEEDADIVAAQAIANAISAIPSLRHLMFEASTIVDHNLLPHLPTNLRHLTLINCWEVRSDIFATFLHTHGRDLRSLTLSHCQSLNLEFLTSLGAACPNLETLLMDLSYFSLHNAINDSEPMYDYVLLPDQVPHWPSSLRVLSLDNVKNCSAEIAKMFLSSLLQNAERLKDLRHIFVKMMLNIPWQERATMRTEWRERMEDVFLRKFEPPTDFSKLNEPVVPDDDESTNPRKRKRKAAVSPARRSGRLSNKGRGSRNNSKRLRHKDGRMDYRDPDTDHDDLTSGTEEDDDPASSLGEDEDASTGPEQYIQGLCNTVSILFDNQKPMELQYGMEDFRDSESDSEEEWNGDDDDEDDTVFVWR